MPQKLKYDIIVDLTAIDSHDAIDQSEPVYEELYTRKCGAVSERKLTVDERVDDGKW